MRGLIFSAVVAVLAAIPGCGSDAECELDTDCPLFQACSDERCVPIGADSGAPTDGGGMDGGRDGGRDGGGEDAGEDAGDDAGTPDDDAGSTEMDSGMGV